MKFPVNALLFVTGLLFAVSDGFFTVVDYVGAFKDAGSDWTKEWTFPF